MNIYIHPYKYAYTYVTSTTLGFDSSQFYITNLDLQS